VALVAVIIFLIYKKNIGSRFTEMKTTNILLLKAINETADMERNEIAKNLHDEIGSNLTVIKLTLTRIQRNINNVELVEKLTAESIEQLSHSISSIRNISNELKLPSLTKLGLEKGLSELCRKINASEKIGIVFNPSDELVRLTNIEELHLYRITQELINNILKHANAREIVIQVFIQGENMKMVISHDGLGISNEVVKHFSLTNKGNGLKNIQSRAEQIKAKVVYYSNEEDGSKITIELPLKNE
jgi:two-component system NarL family sensor kinase